MKKLIAGLVLGFSLFLPSFSAFASVYVSGYTKANGTYVQGYYRSSPNSTVTDNYSYKGNVNPYTGAVGTNSYSNTPTYAVPSYTYQPIITTPTLPSQSGVIGYSAYSCDYFITTGPYDTFAVLEWFSGRWPYTGDKVYGNFDKFGFVDLYTGVNKSKTHVWVEDYFLSAQQAVDKYADKCNLN